MIKKCFFALILLVVFCNTMLAQSTAFTYQGKLSVSGTPTTGNYDFEFRLFDALSGGTQQGATQTLTNVAVDKGIFTVPLDFGVCESCFNGAARFLEITVKPTGEGSFTTLSPRQSISSTPYAIKPLNFTVNGQYMDITTTLATSNTFAGESAGLNTVPAPSTSSILGKFNAFFGASAGRANTTGNFNAFFGTQAGFNNSGSNNAFFGARAGLGNLSGSANAFFGASAGSLNTTGSNNAFFGLNAGSSNTASNNAFFGKSAGENNGTGSSNAYFGNGAGFLNSAGSKNTIVGSSADFTTLNMTGDKNTILGADAKLLVNVSNATAIGANALVFQSNSLVLGSINGINGATADTSVGIGTTVPSERLDISGTGIVRARINSDSNAGIRLALGNGSKWSVATVTGGQFQIYNEVLNQNALWIDPSFNNVGIGTTSPSAKLHVVGSGQITDTLTVGQLKVTTLVPGITMICRDAINRLADCSSSRRYKMNIAALPAGLSLIKQLRPVTFAWKQNGAPDLGLVAEEVAKVEPLLVTHNDKGEIEGVKYDRVSVLLINAVKEQQTQIAVQQTQNESQRRVIEKQQQQINHQAVQLEALKKLLCSTHRRAKACQ